jgi:acyl-CoA thioester hydrolase
MSGEGVVAGGREEHGAAGECVARSVYRARVQWSDTDAGGHHHNTAVTRYVEAAEADLMRDRGLTEYFGTAPRVRYEADFTAPLWFGQEVTVILVLEHVGTSSMAFRFEVWAEEFEEQGRRLAASGRYVTVHVPRGTRGSAPWPAEWVKILRDGAERDEGDAHDGT